MKFAKNAMLNKPGYYSIAAVSYVIEMYERGLEGNISISDCSRAINLDFDIYGGDLEVSLATFDNNVHKAETLVKIVSDFLEQYKSLRPELEKRIKENETKQLATED